MLVLQLWDAHPRVPFEYSGTRFDATEEAVVVKTILREGGYLDNPNLGFPDGANRRDYPKAADAGYDAMYRAIGLVTDDPALVVNAAYLFGYLAVAATAYVALRVLGVGVLFAAAGSVLYSLLPYHLFRGEQHLELSNYAVVPLVVMVVVVQLGDRPWFEPRPRRLRPIGRTLLPLVVAVAAGVSGIYYAAFAAYLFATGGLVAAIAWRSAIRLLAGLVLAALVVLAVAVQLIPSIRYIQRHGENEAVSQRSWEETEHFALRPLELLLPIPGHRLGIGGTAERYEAGTGVSAQELGFVAASGIVGLAASALAGLASGRRVATRLTSRLMVVLLLCLALSMAGGLATLVSLLGFDRLRTWGRIVVVVGFVGIAAVVRWLDGRLAARRAVAGGVAVVLVVAGVLDQTSSRSVPAYDRVARQWEIDRAFVQDAEAALPPRAAILQLPFIPFPESPPVEGMSDYDHARLYLHSDTLRWSYGVVRGRDSWQTSVAGLPLPDVLEAARDVCFAAVEVDRAGYADAGAAVEAQLAPELGPPIATSADDRMALYRLRPVFSCRSPR